jgi:cytochrome c-type biogenesis protein CcmF
MTEAAIGSGLTRGLYVSLGEPVENATDGAWGVRVYVKPFIDWIWAGCILMALGGVFAIADKRYRVRVREKVSVKGAEGAQGNAVAKPTPSPKPADVAPGAAE